MANPTTTPIMTPARGPGNPDAIPSYIVDVFGNPINSSNPLNVNVANANANGQATKVNSAPVTIASDDNVRLDLDTMVPGIQGWIAATGTGAASQDDALTFANQVRKVVIYNAAAVPIPLEFDQAAAATSFPIQPGQYLVFDNVLCTVVHVFPSATLPINTTAGLYVKGWK